MALPMTPAAPRDRDASPRIVALLTAHNRREGTLRCLERLMTQGLPEGTALSVTLVDDGSTDGTAAAVRARFPQVRVVMGSGDLYWNGGMRRAFEEARHEDPDFYLWLNDDTFLLPSALRTLLDNWVACTRADGRPCVVVASTRNPITGAHSYGGWQKGGRLTPLRIRRLPPGPEALRCDTLNGNCVLVPREVVARIGFLDPSFVHAMGDLDYGFRATRAGCGVWIAPGYLAECSENATQAPAGRDPRSVRESWRRLVGPKGLPPSDWFTFTRRHAGPFWPINFAWPYVKWAWSELRRPLVPLGR